MESQVESRQMEGFWLPQPAGVGMEHAPQTGTSAFTISGGHLDFSKWQRMWPATTQGHTLTAQIHRKRDVLSLSNASITSTGASDWPGQVTHLLWPGHGRQDWQPQWNHPGGEGVLKVK